MIVCIDDLNVIFPRKPRQLRESRLVAQPRLRREYFAETANFMALATAIPRPLSAIFGPIQSCSWDDPESFPGQPESLSRSPGDFFSVSQAYSLDNLELIPGHTELLLEIPGAIPGSP